ncbi:MAG: hypothetical protein AB7R89_21210 [Dehalococcoidia bacterium]
MLALAIVAVWFGAVAFLLVRQWWTSELAQVQEGVPASAPVALPAAPALRPVTAVRPTTWSTLHAPVAAAR